MSGRKAYSGLSQDFVLLIGERASYPGIANAPFSMHLTLDMPERFFSMLRFEIWGKLDVLRLEIE
jgi:hypothetical protein